MGYLTRRLSKQQLQTLEDLRLNFQTALRAMQGDLILLLGVGGKVKGLEILSVASDETLFPPNKVKAFAAKFAEIFTRVNSLNLVPREEGSLQFLQVNYSESLNFVLVLVPDNENFVVLVIAPIVAKILRNIQTEKIRDLLAQLFPSQLSGLQP